MAITNKKQWRYISINQTSKIMTVSISFKKTDWVAHLSFWVFMFLFIFDYHFVEGQWWLAVSNTLTEIATYMIIVYWNWWILLPFLWQQKRWVAYCLAWIATVVVYIIVMRQTGWEQYFYIYLGWRSIFSMLLNTSLFLLISLLYWYFRQAQMDKERQLQLQNEKLAIELLYLRQQLSPHFLFNTLNNIYSLVLQQDPQAPKMIAQMAAILQHILYENQPKGTLLAKEWAVMEQYIALQLLRKLSSDNIDVYGEGDMQHWYIAPNLLLNMVENAFKHSSIDQEPTAWIKINAYLTEKGLFVLNIQNSIPTTAPSPSNNSGGIGLTNLQRQLTLYYPQQHQFMTQQHSDYFEAVLQLNLQKA